MANKESPPLGMQLFPSPRKEEKKLHFSYIHVRVGDGGRGRRLFVSPSVISTSALLSDVDGHKTLVVGVCAQER